MILLIGSRAFNHYYPEICEPKDYDLIGSEEEFESLIYSLKNQGDSFDITSKSFGGREYKRVIKSGLYGQIEFELTYQKGMETNSSYDYWNKANAALNRGCINIFNNIEVIVATLSIQYSIKLSHIYRPLNFDKHIKQFGYLHSYLEGKDLYPIITAKRLKETDDFFGKQKTPKLIKADKENFFRDNVEKIRVFEHDEIHRVMAYEKNTPAYTYMQPDVSKVACSKAMFDMMSYERQLNCVLEEAYVIALERILIPQLFIGIDILKKIRKSEVKIYNEEEAFKYALMRD